MQYSRPRKGSLTMSKKKALSSGLLIVVSVLLFCIQYPVYAQADGGVADLVKRVKPAVVTVLAFKTPHSSGPSSKGTGFFVGKNKLVTNWHVVRNAKKITFRDSEGNQQKIAGIAGIDIVNDLAVLVTTSDFKPEATFKISTQKLGVGSKIYVLGRPQGQDYMLSQGLVSSLREIDGREVVQITAAISPDSIGSPVFLRDGSVIGVAVFKVDVGQSVVCAVPIDRCKNLMGIEIKPSASLHIAGLKENADEKQRKLNDQLYMVFGEMYLKEVKQQQTNRPILRFGSSESSVGHLEPKIEIRKILSNQSALISGFNRYGSKTAWYRVNGIDLSGFREGQVTELSDKLVFAQIMAYHHKGPLGISQAAYSVEALDREKLKDAVLKLTGSGLTELQALSKKQKEIQLANAKLRQDIASASRTGPEVEEARDLKRKIDLYGPAAADRPQLKKKVAQMKKRLEELNVDLDLLEDSQDRLEAMKSQLEKNEKELQQLTIEINVAGRGLPAVLWE